MNKTSIDLPRRIWYPEKKD